MGFFSDLIQYGYLSNALAACVLSGITCGVIGTYVVCRRMVFLAGGITHSSFGGLGIAFYLGTDPIAGAMIFAVLSALGIEWAGSRGRIREDSAIGIIWSVGMAVGALFMSLRPGYTSGDLSAYLFGSIVTVTHGDVTALAVLTLFIIAGALLWLRPVMYVAFDRDFARSRGIPTRVISYVMAALIAVTIVLSIRIMGIVLLISLLTMPVAIVNSLSRSYRTIALCAPLVAVAGNVAGLVVSYNFEVPPGAAIIFTLTLTLIMAKLSPMFIVKLLLRLIKPTPAIVINAAIMVCICGVFFLIAQLIRGTATTVTDKRKATFDGCDLLTARSSKA